MLLLLLTRSVLAGGETATTNAEIAHLLGFIRTSSCDFYRNGDWHSAKAAHGHISKKLDYLRERETIKDAEQFIHLAATHSSMSGEVYQIRCPGAPQQECHRWLQDELSHFRKSAKHPR